MAGIGVGVSAAGIVSAGVATGVGIKKSELDAVAMNKNVFKEKWEGLKRDHAASDGQINWETPDAGAVDDFIAQIEEMQPQDIPTDVLSNAESELRTARQNSDEGKRGKILGDVRTGTLVAGTVTNVVGAAVSGANADTAVRQNQIGEQFDLPMMQETYSQAVAGTRGQELANLLAEKNLSWVDLLNMGDFGVAIYNAMVNEAKTGVPSGIDWNAMLESAGL
jgi:hypothetical protein